MKRTTRRKRRKDSSAIRKQTSKRAAQALAAGAAIAAGTQAYAEPIRFDNPAGAEHFVWTASPGQEYLNILSDAASQPGLAGQDGTFWRRSVPGYGEVVRGDPGGASGEVQMYFTDYRFLASTDANEPIPIPAVNFASSGFIEVIYPGYEGTYLPEGTATYLGVRFDPGDGIHYGWIGVIKTGLELDAFAWGYETEPGVPIAAGIPEPGTLAALAFGAVVLGAARRRS